MARADLASIRAYIRQFNPIAASRIASQLVAAADSLADMPHGGRPVAGETRELTFAYPYVIRYRVQGDRVEILRVRHGRRRPEP
jgi:toxin ParE1/3/4